MSRGPGKIMQAILATLEGDRDNAFTVEELCQRAYPGVNRIEKKHRVAVIRGIRNVVSATPSFAIGGARQRGSTLILYRADHLQSYAMFRLKAHFPKLAEAQLKARIEPGGPDRGLIEAGGVWQREVLINIAVRDGDTETAQRVDGELNAEVASLFLRMKRSVPNGFEMAAPRSQCPADETGATAILAQTR